MNMKTYEATIRLTDGSIRDVTVQVEDKPVGCADDTFIPKGIDKSQIYGLHNHQWPNGGVAGTDILTLSALRPRHVLRGDAPTAPPSAYNPKITPPSPPIHQ